MSDQISWLVELAVKPDQLDNRRALTEEMVEAARAEPGVLTYERFVSDDGRVVHLHERYSDSTAALAHLRAFEGTFAGRFLAVVERTRFTLYGAPSAEVKAPRDSLGATYLRHLGGFAR